MNDAWIFATEDGPASETARAVSELGFRPLRSVPNGALRSSAAGSTGRQPAVAIIISAAGEPPPVELYRRLRGDEELGDVPVVLSLEPGDVDDLGPLVDVDELLVRPYEPAELRARIARARRTVNGIETDDVVRLGTLEIDLATYVVTIDGRPVDFTYMEYELLKFLATHPNRAFSRESLLSRVWGYDYYGGARTVDVHVRRVRAKLGQEHAERLKTVRSVGYRWEAT